MKYGRLTVLRIAKRVNRRAFWECLCECGTVKVVNSSDVKNGKIRSCGCLCSEINRAKAIARNLKHGWATPSEQARNREQ